mmetsp:Transcript_64371/g.184879  ORF Transcript_64371/g.184879 Transcript_64371/m.184879 type:complete len:364 (-) Transcript_64371:129-1220(-)
MHECVDGPPDGGVRGRQLLSLLVQASCVEELLQLLVEDLKLSHEGFRVAVRLPALLDQVVARDHVAWVCAPMQLVLQIMLDIILQILGDVVTVGDVTDARHGYRTGELVGKGRERRKDAARDEALGIPARGKLPQQRRDLARGICMGTGPVMPTILLALDLATCHPGQVGLQAREFVQRADFAAFQEGARQVQLVAPTLPLPVLLGNPQRDGAVWANTCRWEKRRRGPCRLRSRRRRGCGRRATWHGRGCRARCGGRAVERCLLGRPLVPLGFDLDAAVHAELAVRDGHLPLRVATVKHDELVLELAFEAAAARPHRVGAGIRLEFDLGLRRVPVANRRIAADDKHTVAGDGVTPETELYLGH